MKRSVLPAALLGMVLAQASPSSAANAGSINLGGAENYTVFALGAGSFVAGDEISLNSFTIYGDVALGAGTSAGTGSGFIQKGSISGNLYIDQQATLTVQTKNTTVGGAIFGATSDLTDTKTYTGASNLDGAVQDAITDSAFYANCANFGGCTNTTVNLNGASATQTLQAGVYSTTNFYMNSDSALTINGSSSDFFVLNVTGTFSFTKSEIYLTGGITWDNVLFNVVGGGNVDVAGNTGDLFQGILLAVDSDITVHELGAGTGPGIAGSGNGGYNGQIIGALNQTLTIKSGAEINGPTNAVPEPPTVLLLGAALLSFVCVGRSRRSTRS